MRVCFLLWFFFFWGGGVVSLFVGFLFVCVCLFWSVRRTHPLRVMCPKLTSQMRSISLLLNQKINSEKDMS